MTEDQRYSRLPTALFSELGDRYEFTFSMYIDDSEQRDYIKRRLEGIFGLTGDWSDNKTLMLIHNC